MMSIGKPGSIIKMDTMQDDSQGDVVLNQCFKQSKAKKGFNKLDIETSNHNMESDFFNNTVNNSPIGTFN